jgi:hypothetical protein
LSVPAPVPLSGFLNLSAVSWHSRAAWPCFVPQPFLGSPLQSFSLTEIAHPSRGRWLPCSYPPACSCALGLTVRRSFPRRPRFHAVALVPRSTMDSLSACRGSLSGRPWFWLSGIAPFRQLHLLRSFVPPARPYLETLGCPAAPGRDSPGFCPPKLSPSTPWILNPPRPRGPEHAPSSEDSGARYEGPRPLLPGEIFLSTSTQEDLVDGFQPP